MQSMQEIRRKLEPFLAHHREFDVEFEGSGFSVVLKKIRSNLLGNFAGGDMAYAANAAAGLLCVAADRLAETASINVECIARAEGDELVARAVIIKSGTKLIRLRSDVFVRSAGKEKLVAIAQINMAPIEDPKIAEMLAPVAQEAGR